MNLDDHSGEIVDLTGELEPLPKTRVTEWVVVRAMLLSGIPYWAMQQTWLSIST